jgi:hypothetical protein
MGIGRPVSVSSLEMWFFSILSLVLEIAGPPGISKFITNKFAAVQEAVKRKI